MDANVILQITLFILIVLGMLFNNSYSRHQNTTTPYTHLRNQALSTAASSLGINSTEPTIPYGVIMEIGFPGSVVTLVSFGNGEAALYLSNGDNVIVDHTPVFLREAVLAFVQKARSYVTLLNIVDSFPLPSKGSVRFYILTSGGIYSAEIPEKQLQKSASILSELYEYGHNVIYQLGKLKHARN